MVLVVSGGSIQSNELQRPTGGCHGIKYLYDDAGNRTSLAPIRPSTKDRPASSADARTGFGEVGGQPSSANPNDNHY